MAETRKSPPFSPTPGLVEDFRDSLERVKVAIAALRSGSGILIADDGARENEVDFVFHAASATPRLVNFALAECRGLLCVSISPTQADRLGFLTSPKSPGLLSHTGFTVSVDAREGIGSGISASDRALTIRLMGSLTTSPQDFVTPGHVFPVRAEPGGLLQRTGHTEAVLEICRMAGISESAAMCEILGDDGEALTVQQVLSQQNHNRFAGLPFVSTVDLIWARVFGTSTQRNTAPARVIPQFEGVPQDDWITLPPRSQDPLAPFLLPYALAVRASALQGLRQGRGLDLSKIRNQILSGTDIRATGAPLDGASACLTVFMPEGADSELPSKLSDLCDLSAKEGIGAAPVATKRLVTWFRATQEFAEWHRTITLASSIGSAASLGPADSVGSVESEGTALQRSLAENLPHPQDREFLMAVLDSPSFR